VLPPFILGLEFAGVVVSAPPSTELKPGEAVFGGQSGSYAEYITIPATEAASLQRIPPTWSFADAAGLGTTLPVSYAALALRGGLKPGETVLVHSAAGGLGIMAVQIALAMGCRVIGTAGSHAKCSYVKGYGASECFNYSQPDWWEKVLEATDNRGVDVVYDSVGLVNVSLKCIAHRGRVLVIGFAGRDGEMETVAMNRVLLKQVSLIGYVSYMDLCP
jgi:NADPH:quinone reductase-like Zn-dependent oxidoreductase